MTARKIELSYEWPPIPCSPFWRAWLDDLGADCSPYGEGPTAQDAIDDLLRQVEETETRK
jgi:hypothetical protein